MHLVSNPATRSAALNTVRELVANGYAGLDQYATDQFVVDPADKTMRDRAETALDQLGATFLRDNGQTVVCLLPRWVRAELDLDAADAPRMVTALASRKAPDAVDYLKVAGEIVRSHNEAMGYTV